ncbi:Dolichyl-diphosphooligosaccharide--protein glycosyltransferase subunit 1 [Geodia barretti]|uniref:Dolichyl-diphosphooligosaccharide--protein glycosyltransferase subunit 1 n=1 Tax=Geodia barretti TaxID=519541 RepID=A0AA35SZK1_GEOBA|nr:Dolichyl-diphosphooligosaccharide--protein glycosyltransferase subunit 1 [Geodia barretti]
MKWLLLGVCLAVFLATVPCARAEGTPGEWEVTLANRQLDLTTHQARQTLTLTLKNAGKKSLGTFLVVVDAAVAGKVAYFGAHEKSDAEDPPALPMAPAVIKGKKDVGGYESEKQLVQFSGNAYILSPYPIKTQSTTVVLATSTIESFSRVAPTSTTANEVTYGPYSDMDPYSSARITIHFENNGTFSDGAILRGSYSRFDHQRVPNSGASSVKSFKTILPAAAADVYYRDEIGNISTSSPSLEGGRRGTTLATIFPSYEYLYHSGSQFLLNMRLVDHVMDDQLVQDLTLRIVLPEGAKNIVFEAPYGVEQQPNDLMQTYLDTVGRPVVVVTANNLVEQHIQDFTLTYEFQTWMLLQEPLLVIVALYGFFLLIIVIVRLDFSITKDVAVLARQQTSVILEKILEAHDRRWSIVGQYGESISSFKQKKNKDEFAKSRRSLDDKFKKCSSDIGKLGRALQGIDTEKSAKARVTELQKKTVSLKEVVDDNCTLAERLVSDRITKSEYLNKEKGNTSNVQRLEGEINSLVKALN